MAFSPDEIRAVYRAISERRDMRLFCGGEVPPEVLSRLLHAAHSAPSVGLMQPWRFIRITDASLRARIYDVVNTERERTAEALGERQSEFMQLKVEGVRESAELFVVALRDGREEHVFGRRTLPQMDLASVSCAIQNMWLAARAEGFGMGWVSIFDQDELCQVVPMPAGAEPIAILCLGPVAEFPERPVLEIEHWTTARPLPEFVSENGWD